MSNIYFLFSGFKASLMYFNFKIFASCKNVSI